MDWQSMEFFFLNFKEYTVWYGKWSISWCWTFCEDVMFSHRCFWALCSCQRPKIICTAIICVPCNGQTWNIITDVIWRAKNMWKYLSMKLGKIREVFRAFLLFTHFWCFVNPVGTAVFIEADAKHCQCLMHWFNVLELDLLLVTLTFICCTG